MTAQYTLYEVARLRQMAERCRELRRIALIQEVAEGLSELAEELETLAAERQRNGLPPGHE